ncbi:hypothetical protein CEXT_290591 [Caerostris extrusa]|uniref:Uncharacterized protein n=1 Tax=Caerostris extrusa TaxID=172846 RepID=A0AAV4MXV1_CAEEX|nr:hypothetical protein CEXT_290591 [Caerostris extrusa]
MIRFERRSNLSIKGIEKGSFLLCVCVSFRRQGCVGGREGDGRASNTRGLLKTQRLSGLPSASRCNIKRSAEEFELGPFTKRASAAIAAISNIVLKIIFPLLYQWKITK